MNFDVLVERGYQKLNFLSKEEVEDLIDFYDKFNEKDENYNPEYAEFTVLNSSLSVRNLIFNKIYEIVNPNLQNILSDFEIVFANYVVKEPGKGAVPIHQNWSFVDEIKNTSYSLWIPLIDVDCNNGTLSFVDKSHLSFRGARGGYGKSPMLNIKNQLKKHHLKEQNLLAGQAIILDDSCIHYSSLNKSDKRRIALQVVITHKDNNILYYNTKKINEDGSIDVYLVDTEFYQYMSRWIGEIDKYKIFKKIKYKPEVFNYFIFLYKYYFKRISLNKYIKMSKLPRS